MIAGGPAWAGKNPFGMEIGAPQTKMHERVMAFAAAYAARFGVGSPFFEYCQTKLTISTSHEPTDGLIPYGVNYNDIRTESELKNGLDQRENYEKTYLVLCLADAKRSLSQTEAK